MFSIGKLTSGVCDILNEDHIFRQKIITFIEDEIGNENALNLSNIELLKVIFNHKDGKKYTDYSETTLAYILNRIGGKQCVFVREGTAHHIVKEEEILFIIHQNGHIHQFKNGSIPPNITSSSLQFPTMEKNFTNPSVMTNSSAPPVGTISTGENKLNMNSTMNSYSTFIPPNASANALIRTTDEASTSFSTTIGSNVDANLQSNFF